MASSHLIRVPDTVYTRLQSLGEEFGMPLGAVVQRLVEQEEERRYWVQFDADYAALRADSTADAEERQERAQWDTTLMDGLSDYPYEDERLTSRTDRQIVSHIPIMPPEGGVRRPSFVMCEQIRILSRERLDQRWGM